MNRRGVKPKHNREIISGIVHILKVGCRWLDCPEVYGPAPRSTIGSTDGRRTAFGKRCWKRWRIRDQPAHKASTALPPRHVAALQGKKGGQKQAIGRSRGGRTTKVHAVANASGRLIAFDLTL
jgi:transposase